MRLSKANFAGLTSPLQHAEMKSILAGTWPPLKPLPVFKYETVAYRATIDFDRKRGEWVCRKTSLPSNEVQELRGGLREITMALPHGEDEIFIESGEQQEQELEKDTNRRLQAIREWREKYQSGARYFELRDYLSESQQTEIDDSLRLSLTARQLQFSSKNLACVFDDLSIAGGRFATLIEFAKQKEPRQGTDPQSQAEGAVPEAECAIDAKQSPGISSCEFGLALNNQFAPDQEAIERCTDADELPAVSIKNVFPEQDQASLSEQKAPHIASQQFEIETSEIAYAESSSLVEHPHQEEQHSPAFSSFAAQVRAGRSPAGRIGGSSSRSPAFEISTFQVAVFASLFLLAVTAFNVGLRVGRGTFGRRLREAPKSILAAAVKSPTTLPEQTGESASQTPTPPVASSNDSAGINKLEDAKPPEEKSKENTLGSENSAEVRSLDPSSSPTMESKPTAKPEVNPERRGTMGPIVRSLSPRVNPKFAHSRKAADQIRSAPRSHAPYRLTSTMGAPPRLPGPSTVLVTVPSGGSQPFKVSFPTKAIAATSSIAMTSQLSVFVPPELGLAVGHAPSRLEAGDLVSFVWPRYPTPGNRYGWAETITVRAVIGQLGQVLDVKFLSGSLSLLPATMVAIRQWRYRPTLLDKTPVQAQQDVTIEFRPPQYSSHLSTHHPSRN